MDADGLDGRGIGGVDVGHDDRTTIKLAFSLVCISICVIYLFCKPPCFTTPTLFHTLLKLLPLQNDFSLEMVFIKQSFNRDNLSAVLIHPPLLVLTIFLTPFRYLKILLIAFK